MIICQRFLTLLVFIALLTTFTAAQTSTRIIGTVVDNDAAVADALVVVQSLADADCAKLFTKKSTRPSRKDFEKLQRCTEDLPELHTNRSGAFSLEVKPGWYTVRVLWMMRAKPGTAQMLCKYGDWMVAFVPSRDSTGKYDAFAQSMPLEVQAGKDVKVDFDYFETLGKKGRCV